jgi:hypothetical protein
VDRCYRLWRICKSSSDDTQQNNQHSVKDVSALTKNIATLLLLVHTGDMESIPVLYATNCD